MAGIDDACVNGDKKDVGIICEFDDLQEGIVIDADYATSLENEHLLNENGLLEIHKVYDGSLNTPKLKTILAVAMHRKLYHGESINIFRSEGQGP